MSLESKSHSATNISAVVITKNEAANIERCIKALQQVAKEIIIVDAFSTDQTVSIVQKLNATVIQKRWIGYGYNKNLGNQLASHDWILSIDADEVLSPELITTIRQISLQESTVYSFNRLVNFNGQWVKHSGWHPDWKVRLFNRKQIRWEESALVHEQLSIPSNFKIISLKGLLYHYSYKDDADHWQRIEHYANLAAQQMASKGKKATFIKLYLSPIARFLRSYLLKKGFLDGYLGWKISYRNAYLVYRKYTLLKAMNNVQIEVH